MERKTNLEELKKLAIDLIEEVPIGKTEFWPAVAQHFFTDSGTYPVPNENGGYDVGFLEEGSPAYDMWKNQMKDRVNAATKASNIYSMVTKPWTLLFVKFAEPFLSEEEFTGFFRDSFIKMEFPNSDPNFPVSELVSYFEECDPNLLMHEDDLEVYNNLPDIVTVYRGVTSNNLDGVEALSWSLSPEKAEWFATRFSSIKGRVYSATIHKNDIFAYFGQRGEQEVIVDPDYLENIEVYKDFM